MYGKLFVQMYDGTLATRGPWQALVTFQQFIILADQSGVVDMTAEAISRRTTLPLEIIQIGIAALEQPDEQSRTPDLEGRRIVKLNSGREWGWQIVNYAHYRKIRSQEERREYMRKYQREYRAKKAAVNQDVNNVSNINQSSKQYAVSSKNQEPVAIAPSAPPKASTKTGQRLPQEWDLPDDWKQWAVTVFKETPQRVYRVSLDFRDYWHAKAGRDGVKLDWLATWRRWCRKEFDNA